MYVVQFECVPNDNIPDEHMKFHKYWLINNDDRTRMPITEKAIEYHRLHVTEENMNIDIKWGQSQIFNIFVFDLLPGVCEVPEVPVPTESRTPRSSMCVNKTGRTPRVSEVTLPMTTATYISEPMLPMTSENTATYADVVNNGIKDIYSNDSIQDKFVVIYQSIGKVKSNGSLIMDIIHEFNSMKTKGINVGAALPDLEIQYGDLTAFEREALEEINKINMLNKMLVEQVNALETKCIKKSLEIDEINH